MSRLKSLVSDAPVHERKLDFRTYPLDNDRLIVEGILKDERLVPGYHWDGETRPQGVVHHMVVRLLLEGWPPTIMEAEAEMKAIPHELCPTAMESVREIIGLQIASGYSEEIRNRIGGQKGCAHLTHLITAMGPAAMHGYWTEKSRTPRPIPGSLEEFGGLSVLLNSCRLWREDGPMIGDIREKLAGK